MKRVRSLSASEVAELLVGKKEGDEEMQIFGVIFHELFSFHEYKCTEGPFKWGFKKFTRRLAAACRQAGLKKEWVTYGIRLASAFVTNGVAGRTPPTAHVEIADGILLHAKPDLFEDWEGKYFELKTQPITKFDEVQSAIFALALSTEITLVGPEKSMSEWVKADVRKIQPYQDKEKIIELIKEYGREELIEKDKVTKIGKKPLGLKKFIETLDIGEFPDEEEESYEDEEWW